MASDLDSRLLSAHATGDRLTLIRLYQEAADAATDEVAAGFYLTHAWVFALEAGNVEAAALQQRLKAMGRA